MEDTWDEIQEHLQVIHGNLGICCQELCDAPNAIYSLERLTELLVDISQKKKISFNENIKNLILQIFSINIDKKFKNNNTVGIENLERKFNIRDYGDKYLYHSFADNEINNANEKNKSYKDYNDQIALKLISNKFQNPICYHRSNTVGKILRGISVTNCIEIDLNFIDENLYIYHPSAENTFFNLEDLKILTKNKKNLKIWIDIKNIDFNKCVLLNKKINDLNFDYKNLFLEFPPDTENQIKDINLFNCLKKLNNKTNVSYYIPTAIGINCLSEINNLKLRNHNCNEFLRIVNSIKNSGIFRNISFDYNIYDLINYYQLNDFFILNTWAVNPHDINSIEFSKFNYIIFDVKDINNL